MLEALNLKPSIWSRSVGRIWSLLFLLVPLLGVAVFFVAAFPGNITSMQNHWFPEDASGHGYVIDNLFLFILLLTGVIFVGTGLALFWFLWKYDSSRNQERVAYTHGSHVLEVVWSVIPAATLLFIAIYQMNAWAAAKMRYPETEDGLPKPALAEVTGRQFEWRIRYPGQDGQLGTQDDLHTVNDLHVPVNEEAVFAIKSEDVLHSFFIPSMRVKQDVVPGMKQYIWFQPVKEGRYDIVCAELCGWGHYKMKGRLTVESRQRFEDYLNQLQADQNRTSMEE